MTTDKVSVSREDLQTILKYISVDVVPYGIVQPAIDRIRAALQQSAAPDLSSERKALENVRLLAARHRKDEWAQHMLRFCREAGVTGSVLRDEQPIEKQATTNSEQISIREQLLQYVPPVEEWPEWATYYVARCKEGHVGFVGDHWRSVHGDIIFGRDEVKAART